ncbi:MAG: hypothetical protein U0230_02025 [Polyangiales bacterium]
MGDVIFGPIVGGVRFGLRVDGPVEAGGTVVVELLCENLSHHSVHVFGFAPDYPRTLRVSPPKPDRPFIRVSFGDTSVLHPPEAFVEVMPGGLVTTGLDLSFAFDRRGVGLWQLAFVYEPVRAGGRFVAYRAPEGLEATTGILGLSVVGARSVREGGIDERTEAELEAELATGAPALVERLRAFGPSGASFAARRVARIEASASESVVGYRALDVLLLLGDAVIPALARARLEMPHARASLAFAEELHRHRRGDRPLPANVQFASTLDRLVAEPAHREGFLLTWTPYDLAIHGMQRMTLLGSGDRIVSTRPPGAPYPATRKSTLTEAQVTTVLEALRYSAVWLLRPLRTTGIPDEPTPVLEVELGPGEPLHRQIAMWNGEWKAGPGATLAALLDGLATEGARESSLVPPA